VGDEWAVSGEWVESEWGEWGVSGDEWGVNGQ
jgi:hypothetical protein